MSEPFVTLPLALRLIEASQGKAEAWVIPGSDANAWLAELATWREAASEAALYILPTSIGDLHPGGLLVVPTSGAMPRVGIAQPYRRVHDALFVPQFSSLEPPVTEAELRRLCPHAVMVFHPAIGLVGFGDDDRRRIGDLLVPPRRTAGNWSAARSALPVNRRLLSVHAEALASIDGLIESGRDDIATLTADDLPVDGPEKSAGALGAMREWLVGSDENPSLLGRLFGKKGPRTPRPKADESARQRELRRLLEMLGSNIDAGLRFAVPLGGAGARGIATPGNKLTPRSTDFNLNALGGGRPADPWQIEHAMRERLTAEYRRAATRELNLGRYRRAAYVFASLLGDLPAAANALKQGRLYREAAILLRDKLNDPLGAAACLEAGGLLQEAAALYVSVQKFEAAGVIYEKLDQTDDAARCFRDAVQQALQLGDRRLAAKLLEERLRETDGALATLRAGWPGNAAQPAVGQGCLREYFALLARHGRHAEARHEIEAVAINPLIVETAPLVTVLVELANDYPNDAVRARSADVARVSTGRRLADPDNGETSALLAALARLDPADRLLSRDCARYGTIKKRPATPRPAARTASPRVDRFRSFSLGRNTTWRAVTAHGEHFYALGARGHQNLVARGSWAGAVELYETGHAVHGDWLAFAPNSETLMASSPAETLVNRFKKTSLKFGRPEFLPAARVEALTRDARWGVIWAIVRDEALNVDATLNAYVESRGALVSSLGLPVLEGTPFVAATPSREPFVICGTQMIGVAPRGGALTTIALPRVATGIAPSSPFGSFRLAITLEERGALMYWPGGDVLVPFGEDVSDAKAVCLPSGEVVLAGRERGCVYRCEERNRVVRVCEFETTVAGPPLAVVAATGNASFAVVIGNGTVLVFRGP